MGISAVPNKFQKRVEHVDDLPLLLTRTNFGAVRCVFIEGHADPEGFLLVGRGEHAELLDPLVLRVCLLGGVTAHGTFDSNPPPLPVLLGRGFNSHARARLEQEGPGCREILRFFHLGGDAEGGGVRLSAALKQLTGRSRRECLELLADLEEGEAPHNPLLWGYE